MSDFTLSTRSDRQSYPQGQAVTLTTTSVYRGQRPCSTGRQACPPPRMTVEDSSGKVVWYSEPPYAPRCYALQQVMVQPGETRSLSRTWDQDECDPNQNCNSGGTGSGIQAPRGTYRGFGHWDEGSASGATFTIT